MYKTTYRSKNNVTKRSDSYKVLRFFLAAGAVVLAASDFYAIRDLLAGLLIFSVLFVVVGTALLILILLQEAALWGVTQVESHWTSVRARYAVAAAKRFLLNAAHNQNHTG